jgi:MFS family permease
MGAAFPLLVATLTRDPLLVSGATLAGRLPWFLFALLSGALVDRMDRRRVMMLTDASRAVGVGLFAWGVATGATGLAAVYLVAFGLGVAETFFDTSAEAFTPSLVGSEQLPAANGRLQGLEWAGGSFIGPPIGAALFVSAAALPFLVNSAALVLAALLIAAIPGRYRTRRVEGGAIRSEIATGLRWLWGQRVVRSLALMAGVTNFFTFGIIAVFVLFALEILGVPEGLFGVLLAALGVGGLAGAVIAPRLVATIGEGNTLRTTIGLEVLASGIFALTTDVWVAGSLMAIFGLLITTWNVVAVSLRQELTPDEMRGRVAGASRLFAFGTQPLGAVAGGVLASLLGLRAPFVAAALAFTAMLVLTWGITSNQSIEQARAGAVVAEP